MKKHVISKELQSELDALSANDRAKAANPVAKLTAFVLVDATVDADRLLNKLLVQATDAAGGYVKDVSIEYRVIDENRTGSKFVRDGAEFDISSGLTEGDEGFALANDYLLTGKIKPGTFIVRATAPSDADPETVFADFRITISDQVPTSIRIVKRGDPLVPIGEFVAAEAKVEVLDREGHPITFGSIQVQLYDPSTTESLYLYNGGVVNYLKQNVVEGGTDLFGYLAVGAAAPGKEFYLRVNRVGRDPTLDIPYTAVQTKSRKD